MPESGRLKKFFGGMRALAVTSDLLTRYVNQCREAGLSNATINRDMAAPRRAFSLAVKAGKIPKAPTFPHFKESAARAGFVKIRPRFVAAVHARLIGFRKSELANLKVSQVDLAARTIRLNVGETKSGEGRLVKMTNEAYTLLAACISGKQPHDHVFTYPNGTRVQDFGCRWDKLTTKAGRPGLLFHGLRRSAVRNMVRRGIPEVVAMRISGHKTGAVFDRYNIVSESDLADAAVKIKAGRQLHSQFIYSFTENRNGAESPNGANRYN